MRLPHTEVARRSPRRLGLGLAITGVVLSLGGCGLAGAQGKLSDGYLPEGATEGADRVRSLWLGSWIAALAVGGLVWGLTIWCMVGVLFYYTDRDERALTDTATPPDVVVNVVGKQWSWDFNYVTGNAHEAGTQAQLTGKPGVEATLPTLYIPVNKRVEFQLTANDVIHSFWVPAFLQKLDMIPGRVNTFQVVPTREGTYAGKCAELCGAYHSRMLFNLRQAHRGPQGCWQ